MEYPIKIIITMVVAIIVGIILINFSQNIISKSQKNLDTLSEKDVNVFKIQGLTEDKAAYLAESCLKTKEISKGLCFIVINDNPLNCNSVTWNQLGYQNTYLSNNGKTGNTIYFYKNSPEKVYLECN